MILLINPPTKMEKECGIFSEFANIVPPLGLAYVAGYLEQEGYDVEMVDCPVEEFSHKDLEEVLSKRLSECDLVGLTATVQSIYSANAVAKMVKEMAPQVWVIIGGPHPSSVPEEVMGWKYYDIGVIGEGEITASEIVRGVYARRGFSEIDGIIFRSNGKLIRTRPRRYIDNLDILPFPARHLLPPLDRYNPLPVSCLRHPFATMFTSRGCPFHCTFCHDKVFGKRVRYFSAKRVVDEMAFLVQEHGVKDIYFHDDIFTLNKTRMFAVCEGILDRNLDVTWACNMRATDADRALLKQMKKAGCWQVLFGLESGNQMILDNVKKGVTLEDGREAVRVARELGFVVRVDFIIGLPWETTDTLQETFEFAKSLKADFPLFNVFVPYPGVPLEEEIIKAGQLRHKNYDDYSSMPRLEGMSLPYVPPGVTQEELVSFCQKSYLRLYLNAGYILRSIYRMRHKNDIIRYWNGLKTLFRMARFGKN